MATVINFGGKTVIEPGVYAITAAQVQNVPQDFSSGNVMIIDTGSGAGFGGGSGIDGTLKKGMDSIYSFDNLVDFRNFVRGGLLWDIADYIFNPLNGSPGAPKLMIARAATTEPAYLVYSFNGGLVIPTYTYAKPVPGLAATQVTTLYKKASNGYLFAGSNGDIFVSTDNGANWTSGGATVTGNIYQITSTGNGNLYAASSDGVWKSTNNGTSWTAVNTGLTSTTCFSIAGTTANEIYVATFDGLFKSTNAGASWAVTAVNTFAYAVATNSSGDVFVSKPFNGVYISTNSGLSFTAINTGILNPAATLVQSLWVNPATQDVYAGTNSSGIYRTTNSGVLWAQVNTGLTNYDVRDFDVNSSGYVFCATATGVFQSVDSGVSWINESANLPASFSWTIAVTATDFLLVGTYADGPYVSNVVTTGGVAQGGVVVFETKNEGTGANGVIYGGKISTGYGAQMKAGTIDVNKFVIEFYEGTYRGLDPDGDDYGGVSQTDSPQSLVAKSIEFDNISQLIAWAQTDSSFAARFNLVFSSVTNSGAIANADLVANANLVAFSGATELYSGANLDTLLSNIVELDNTFFLCDQYASDAQSVSNTKILSYITNVSEFEKFMIIGGGNDETTFVSQSIATAQYYNNQNVAVVHSGFKIPKLVGSGLKTLTSFYHAACVVGRLAGIAPQTPLTFKAIKPTIFNHQLKKSDREYALQNGVLHNRFVPGIGFVVNQGINSLQRNTQMINPDGTSCEISVMRIAAQLNKELVLNMRPIFIGGNLNTSSPADVKSFVEGYLTRKTASKNQDNLIINFKNVTVKQVQDYYKVDYQFVPNSPVNKIFVTGFILDANLSA